VELLTSAGSAPRCSTNLQNKDASLACGKRQGALDVMLLVNAANKDASLACGKRQGALDVMLLVNAANAGAHGRVEFTKSTGDLHTCGAPTRRGAWFCSSTCKRGHGCRCASNILNSIIAGGSAALDQKVWLGNRCLRAGP